MIQLALVALLILTASDASAKVLTGRATVIDGDMIEIQGERIRILDIDAPELDQTCSAPGDDAPWSCGRWAAHALSKWISPYLVTCRTLGTDNLGRWRARCDLAGVSISTWMAGEGWAVPNQDCACKEVREASSQARKINAGIWRGEFQMPWEWRKAN